MIAINMDKVKAIAHNKRRAARNLELAPLDDLIAKQIPGTDIQAVEAQRQEVRDKYAALQETIDNALTVDELKAVMQQVL